MRRALPFLALTCLASPLASEPRALLFRPVMVAGHGDFDACLSTAFVKDFEGYLSVRASPNIRAREIGRIRPGHVVWDCDASKDGEWTGIVYHPRRRTQEQFDCELGPSDTPRRPYRGNCRSGWVSARYLVSLAG